MRSKNIFVAGHDGMVGSAFCKALSKNPTNNLITVSKVKCDLSNQAEVNKFFQDNSIDQVILTAAKVGGIEANNSYPADFLYQNLLIQSNVIHASHINNVNKLLFLGSSCIYPKNAAQPISESDLLSGKLEATNEPYAIAKIAGIKLCESYNRQYDRDYRSIMPTNLYGPNDNYNLETSHVIPALIKKIHIAKELSSQYVAVWGTGLPLRDFMHVDDLIDAAIFINELEASQLNKFISPMCSHINISSGLDYSISQIAELIAKIIGFNGSFKYDSSKPDGAQRKLMDSSIMKDLGWNPKINLEEGLHRVYDDFLAKKNYQPSPK